MKLVTWNVNGLRAAFRKGFPNYYSDIDADVFAIQETKMQEEQVTDEMNECFKDKYVYFYDAVRKGYSGTASISKEKPINVYTDKDDPIIEKNGFNILKENEEGRILTLEFDKFYFVNAYVPNSKDKLQRLEYRCEWNIEMTKYLSELDKIKPVIYCGDLNVAHKEIDLANPTTNRQNAGFTDEEREKMTELLDAGFIDAFRYLYPDKTDAYSWWSYRANARANNVGWRIDYFIVSDRIKDKIVEVKIDDKIEGSDHCPVVLEIDWSK